jgi:hypothetical protein
MVFLLLVSVLYLYHIEKGCKDQNCTTSTQLSTGTTQPNPCREPTQYHQQPIASHPLITQELVGNTTSKVPPNKKETTVDNFVQANGAKKPQKMCTEKVTVPVSATSVKENGTTTAYLQQNDRTEAIINAMPADSIIK